jgi:hypothetical protein
VRRVVLLLSLAVAFGLPAPAKAERPGWYANPSLDGPAQVGATLSGNPGGIKCDNCLGTSYEWLSCTGPEKAGADRPTGGLPFDGKPAPGCVIRVPFPGSLSYVVRPDDAGRYIQLHIVAENHDCGEVNYSDGTQECRNSQGHGYTNTVGPIAGAAPAPPATPPAPAAPAAPTPATPPLVAPESSARPVISGYAEEKETLTVSAGTWSGSEPIAYTFQWFRCSSELNGCQAIEGATGTSYTLGADDVGSRITATVTAGNPVGRMPATAPLTAHVLPAQPRPGFRVLDVTKLRSVHRLVVARIEGPKIVRPRGTATLLVHVADARGFLVKGAEVEVSRPTGSVTAVTGANGVAIVRVGVGAPRSGRITLTVTAAKPGEDAPTASATFVLRVRG